jgi:hypothetical protein
MNYSRGFWRLWIIMSVCWISRQAWILFPGLWSIYKDPRASFLAIHPDGLVLDERLYAAAWMLLPPLLLLLLGIAAAWVASGFKP